MNIISETINDRFKQVKDYFGLSVNKFAQKIGVSQPSAKAIIDGSNEPSNKAINGLAIGFPMVSMDWLVRGIGEMFTNCGCSSADDASIYHPSQNGTCTDFATDLERNQSEAEAKDGRSMSAADLARDNARLRQELALKNKLIADQAVRLSRYEAKQ